MVITKKLIAHLASLSRLRFKDAESARFTKDLNGLLKYFKELDAVDVSGIEPMIGAAELKNVMRADTVSIAGEAAGVDEEGHIIGAFPEAHEGHLKVPKIL